VSRLAFLLVVGLYFALPMLWMVLAPSKTREQLAELGPFGFGSFANYGRAFKNLLLYNDGELLVWTGNSAWYSALGVALSIATSLPAGYALARTAMRWRRAILLATLIVMVTPSSARTIPLYLVMDLAGLLNTPWAIILPHAFFPFGVYLAYIYFSTSLPPSLLEAARIDGASEFGAFRRVALPLAAPAVGLITFFSFIAIWNEFFMPYIMLSSDRLFNLPVGLATLMNSVPGLAPGTAVTSNLPIYQPEVAMAGLLVVVPIMIVFLASQRYLAAGVLEGAVKD
jgi:multiple sugar transport system permease protein